MVLLDVMRLSLAMATAALTALVTVVPARSQSFPTKPVRLILPYPPGGSTDIMGRMAAGILSTAWGVQVIADNRVGAAGNVGSDLCAKSRPDGYTMCTFSVAQSIAPSVYQKLPFDPLNDFSHVTLMAILPALLVVHPSVPVRSTREIIAFAKKNPGVLNYASTGNGSSGHMMMELFKLQTGTKLVHIPFRGTGAAMIDQVSGQVEVGFSAAISSLPFIKQGKLIPLAVSTKVRYPTLPDLPTVDESGIKGFDGSSWQGFAMPAGVPRDIVNRTNENLVKGLKSPEIVEKVLAMGGIVSGNTPEEFVVFLKEDMERWARVSKAAKISID